MKYRHIPAFLRLASWAHRHSKCKVIYLQALNDFRITNPPGFKSEHAIKVKKMLIRLAVSSLFEDKIHIDEILIENPEISYELGRSGNNIKTLTAHAFNYDSKSKTSDSAGNRPKTAAKTSTKLIIKKLELHQPKLTFVLAGVSAPITLPDIHLEHVGGRKGATPAAVAIKLLLALKAAVAKVEVKNIDSLKSKVESQLKGFAKRLKKLF